MGFDDSELAMYSTPALSTVRISYQDEGVTAAEELFGRIDGGRPAAHHPAHPAQGDPALQRLPHWRGGQGAVKAGKPSAGR